MNKRALIYARCSAEESAVKGLSIADQLAQCRERAGSIGVSIEQEYVDEAISGASVENRPAFQAMIREVTRKDRDYEPIVIVLNTSRFSRSPIDAITYEQLFERHGVAIDYVQLPSTDSPYEEVIRLIFHAIDRFHSLASKVSSLRGLERTVELGYRAGGAAPYGYKLKTHILGTKPDGTPYTRSTLEPDPETAPIVREYWDRRAAGEARHAIAKDFTRREIPTPTGKKQWASSTFIHWEENVDIYLGHLTWRKSTPRHGRRRRLRARSEWIIKPNCHEPIITKELAESVLAHKRRPTWARPESLYLLSGGLLLCGACGSPMYGHSSGSKVRYYYCPVRQKESRAACPNSSMRADLLEDFVLTQIRRELREAKDVDWLIGELESAAAQGDLTREIGELHKDLEEVSSRRRKWEGLFEQGEYPESYMSEKLLPLINRGIQLERDIRSLESQRRLRRTRFDRNTVRDRLSALRRAERPTEIKLLREALRIILDAVEISPKRQDGCREVKIIYSFAENAPNCPPTLGSRKIRTFVLATTRAALSPVWP